MAATVIDNGDGGRCPFYRHRDTVLLQVAADSGLSGAAVKVAIMLAQKYLNREKFLSGDLYPAWPSNATLEDDTGLNKTTVLAGIKQLETRGHMRVKRAKSKGRNSVNHYGFVIKPPANGGENTTNKALENGCENTTNKSVNGGKKPPLMVAKKPPDSIEEHPDGAGARSRAPQAPEPDDGSDNERDQNHSQSDIGDSGAHERPQSTITATESPPKTASELESESEERAFWEDEISQSLIEHMNGGCLQGEADHGPLPAGGLEYCEDDSQAWNAIAFPVFQDCDDLFDQEHDVTIRPNIVLLAILEKLEKYDFRQSRDFGDAFAKACVSPELQAAAFRHIRWWLEGQKASRPNEVIARLRRVVSEAIRRRAKALRHSEQSDLDEVASGR